MSEIKRSWFYCSVKTSDADFWAITKSAQTEDRVGGAAEGRIPAVISLRAPFLACYPAPFLLVLLTPCAWLGAVWVARTTRVIGYEKLCPDVGLISFALLVGFPLPGWTPYSG